MWPLLVSALESIGSTPRDIDAIVLTHGHFDHVGMCRRLHEHHVLSHVHERDRVLVKHPYQYAHEAPRAPYPFRYPAAIPILARMIAAGAIMLIGSMGIVRRVFPTVGSIDQVVMTRAAAIAMPDIDGVAGQDRAAAVGVDQGDGQGQWNSRGRGRR